MWVSTRTGQDLHRGELAGGLDGKLRKNQAAPIDLQTSQGFLKNHIKPQIGGIPLADLTSLDLQRFYKHLLDGGRVDRIEAKKKPKGLAPKTVRNIHQMIGSAYNLAIEQRLVTKNPTQGCALPKVEHKEMKTLTATNSAPSSARPGTAACTNSTTSTSPRDCAVVNCWV